MKTFIWCTWHIVATAFWIYTGYHLYPDWHCYIAVIPIIVHLYYLGQDV